MVGERTTQTMKASEARQHFSDIVNRVYRKQVRVLVERSGIPVAAIVSVDDLERLDRLEQERAERFAGLSRISQAFADVPVEDLERQVERAVTAGRVDAKARREQATAPTKR